MFNPPDQPGTGEVPLALVNPQTPCPVYVAFADAADPGTYHTVELRVLPAGRGHLSATVFTMKDGDVASLLYYPDAVSQRVEDTFIVSYLDNGGEGDREAITNVGVVMPTDVRGPDTAAGEKDRISQGDGNWGRSSGWSEWPRP